MSKSEYALSAPREDEVKVVIILDDSGSMYPNSAVALDSSIDPFRAKASIVTINRGRVRNTYRYEAIGLTDLTVAFREMSAVAVPGAKLKVFIVTDGLHNMSSSLDALNSAWQTAEHLRSLGCSLDVKLLLIGSCANYTEYPSYFVFFKALLRSAFTWGIRYEDRILASHKYLLRDGYDDWSSVQSMLLIGAGLNQLSRHRLSPEQRDAIGRFTEAYAATLAPKAPKAGGLTVVDLLEDADTSEHGLFKAMTNCELSGLWSMIRDATVKVDGVILSAAWKAFILAATKPLQDAIVELKLKDTEMFKALIDAPPGSVHVLSADPAGNLRVCENVLMALGDASNTVCLPFPAAKYVDMSRIYNKLVTKNGEQLHPSTNIGHMLNMLLQQLFKALNKGGRVEFLTRFIIPASSSFHRFYAMNWCRPGHSARQTIADLVRDMTLAQGVAQSSEYNTQETQYGGHVWMCLMSFFLNCSGKSKADQTEELRAVLVMLTKFGTKYSSSGYELYEFRIDLDQIIAVTGLSLRDLIEMNLLILEQCEVKDDAGTKVVVARSKLLTFLNSFKKRTQYGEKIPMDERDYSRILSFWTTASVGATKDCINVVKDILGLAIDCDAISGIYNAVGPLSQNTKYVTNPLEYTHGAVLFSKFMNEYGVRIDTERYAMRDQHRLRSFDDYVKPGVCFYCRKKSNTISTHLLRMSGVYTRNITKMFMGLFFLPGCDSVGASYRRLLSDGLSLHGEDLAKDFVNFYMSEAGEHDLKFLDKITPANIRSANRVTDKGNKSSCQLLADAYPRLPIHRERMVAVSASSEYSGAACAAGNATGGFNATASNSSSCVASVSSGGARAAYATTTSMLTGGSAVVLGALSGSPSAMLAGVRLLTGSGGASSSSAVPGSNATASGNSSSCANLSSGVACAASSGGSAYAPTTPAMSSAGGALMFGALSDYASAFEKRFLTGSSSSAASVSTPVSVPSGGAGVGSSTVSAAPSSSSGGGASAASPSANNWGFERDDSGHVTNYSAGNQAIIEAAYRADPKGKVSVTHEITQGSKKGTVFEHTLNFAKNLVIDVTNAESYPLVR